MRSAGVAALLVAGLALVGCTAPTATPTTAPSASANASAAPVTALGALHPVFPDPVSDTSVEKESTRVADAIQALIASPAVVHVDDHARLVPATSTNGRYYGILRTVTVDASLDPIAQTTAMAKLLVAAGWIERQTGSDTGKYLDALASGTDATRSWFVIVGADSTDSSSPVVTIQLASPDLGPPTQ
ncbi:hypothetical protein [Galbitalea soli]|uniref:Uncharacterized protein n=1 Tax=Galbitalea soli TaxID=1268042 RepID=A0A7C9PNC2_9MICO|nr:hypothetical protein [Galbitalea soli]NEM91593.1 hypothetical protein [Galbitalea soli]NYJ30287.1 hypothetical protein [Galbitalea soli]